MQIIDGKKLRNEILDKIKREVSLLKLKPVFCDVLVGNDLVSAQYVNMKARSAESVGIAFHKANFPLSISMDDLAEEIKILNKIPNMCGIIIQLPLPKHIDIQMTLDSIDPQIDVDCLGRVRSEMFYNSYNIENDLGFPTALACMALLDSVNLNLKDKKIVVLGQGALVGKPVAALLRLRNLSPAIITSKTLNKEEIIKQADIIISGIGNGKYIKGDMIKKGATIIDAGTSESSGGIVGDVDLDSVKDVAGYLSPVPGGVGPVTVAMLLNNVLKVAKQKNILLHFLP